MSPALRIARRELRGGVRGFRVFLACLALGVAAIAAVGTVRESIERGLEQEGAVILGGDASVELEYRFAEPEERAWLETLGNVSEIVDFRSMAVAGEERGLTQVKGVDSAYPLVGVIELRPQIALAEALAGKGGLPGAVMDETLVERMGLDLGSTFRLGTQDFVLTAALLREPDSATGGFGLGPRTIVRTDDLANSGLLGAGTLFESEYRLRLPEGSDLDAIRAATEAELGRGADWDDRRDAARGVSQFVDRLSAFLVLTGLAGLAVGGVGISAAVRAYLDEKVETIATLKTLGAERATIFNAYALQIGLLTICGIVAGLAIGLAISLGAAPLIEARLPVPAAFGVYPGPLAAAALYGALTAALFTLWPLARTEEVRAAALFRGVGHVAGWPRARWLWMTALLLAALVGAAALLSGLPISDFVERWRTCRGLCDPRGGGLGGASIRPPGGTRAPASWVHAAPPGARLGRRSGGGDGVGRAVARAWPDGSGSGGAGRLEPPPGDPQRPAAGGAFVLCRRHPAGPDRGFPRSAR